MRTATIQSGRLCAKLLLPGAEPYSQRFAAAGAVASVVLDGSHEFCTPEQVRPGRVSCGGIGLCSEFVWDELADVAPPGGWFPKLGVGLLRQRAAGGAYEIFHQYDEVRPFEVDVELFCDRAVYLTQAEECLGVAVRMRREVRVEDGWLHMQTDLHNVGHRAVACQEYVHNFVSLDGLPTGPGYRLTLPFDGGIQGVHTAAFPQSDFADRRGGFLRAEKDTVVFERDFEGYSFHKITEAAGIAPQEEYYWRLWHDSSPLYVEEHCGFVPTRLVLWGVEHCICAEVYAGIHMQPGESARIKRSWKFGKGE